jgi:hypothetical protein
LFEGFESMELLGENMGPTTDEAMENQLLLAIRATGFPFSFVSESLGGTVRWDGATSTAYIVSAVGGTENTGAVKSPKAKKRG